MADEISDLRFFARLVASGSLSALARGLDASPAAMSRRLAALEARLGVRLITRTTRSFELTPEGSRFHERCIKIIKEIDEAEAEAAAGGAVPHGLLRIGVPIEIGRRRIAPLVAAFVALYPQVEAHLVLSDAFVDFSEDHLDVALHAGLPREQGLVAMRLLAADLVICAAPAYLARHGTPREPADILDHNCIRLVRGNRVLDSWTFEIDGVTTEMHVHGTLSTTSAEVVHDWALAGHGVAMKAFWDVEQDLAEGRLVRCLVPYRKAQITLYAVHAGGRLLPPRVRLFLDYVREGLEGN